MSRLDGSLRALAALANTSTATSVAKLKLTNPAARLRVASPLAVPEVLVEAVASQDATALEQKLSALGLRETSVFANSVGGWLPVSALADAAAVPELRLARASMRRLRAVGPVSIQGDYAQRSAVARATNSTLTGSGVAVGAMSDSFDCYDWYASNGFNALSVPGDFGYANNGFSASYTDDQASGALPSGVQVVQEVSCSGYLDPVQPPFQDEGRAMLQIVHSVAPGATLMYRTAVTSEADFANGIVQLQQKGARVIVDDVGYLDEPFFQDGMLAQAVDQVAAEGVAFFSSAGNDGRNAWESLNPVFANVSANDGEPLRLQFASGVATLPVSLPAMHPGAFIALIAQWDQPYITGAPGSPGSANALDMCIDNADTVKQSNLVWSSEGSDGVYDEAFELENDPTCTGPNAVGADPLLIMLIGNPADALADTVPQTLQMSIRLAKGQAPGRVKLLVADGGIGASVDPSMATQSATIQGHPGAAGAVAVAASFYMNTPACGVSPARLETFSSWGGDPILFDKNGNRLATPLVRGKPDLTAPDGANDTAQGNVLTGTGGSQIKSCQNNPAYPSFFGTSAAAPHAAAAAALLMQAYPQASTTQVITALKSTAFSMGSAQAGGSGAGFIQVDAALTSLQGVVGTGTSSTSTTGTASTDTGSTSSSADSGGTTSTGDSTGSAGAINTGGSTGSAGTTIAGISGNTGSTGSTSTTNADTSAGSSSGTGTDVTTDTGSATSASSGVSGATDTSASSSSGVTVSSSKKGGGGALGWPELSLLAAALALTWRRSVGRGNARLSRESPAGLR